MHARCVTSWSGFARPNGASTSVGSSARERRRRARRRARSGATGSIAGVVRVLDEVEVHRGRVEQVERGVGPRAGAPPSRRRRARSPLCTSHLRIGSADTRAGCRRTPSRPSTPGCTAMKLRAAEHRVVEVRRHDHDPVELAVGAAGPTRASGTSSSTPDGVRVVSHGVQPRVDALGLLVQRAELAVALVVDRRGSRGSGVERLDDPHVAARCRRRRSARARCPRAAAAPRALARIGCSTWRICAVEHVGHDPAPQLRLRAAADEVAATGTARPMNFSTSPSSQRLLYATPSSTERTSSARVVASDRLCQPPRSVWSSTGVRSPFSQGVKITPLLPGATRAGDLVEQRVEVVGRRRLRSASLGEDHVVASQSRHAPATSCSSAT